MRIRSTPFYAELAGVLATPRGLRDLRAGTGHAETVPTRVAARRRPARSRSTDALHRDKVRRRLDSLGIARALTLALAAAAVAMLLASGPGTRLGLWTWQTGFAWVKWGFYAGAVAGVCALVLVALLVLPRFRARPWIPVLSLGLALGAIAPPLALLSQAKSVPRIHDISTDTDDPPAFVSLLAQRRAAPNGFAYGGAAVAAEQHRGYPEVKPLVVPTPPARSVAARGGCRPRDGLGGGRGRCVRRAHRGHRHQRVVRFQGRHRGAHPPGRRPAAAWTCAASRAWA